MAWCVPTTSSRFMTDDLWLERRGAWDSSSEQVGRELSFVDQPIATYLRRNPLTLFPFKGRNDLRKKVFYNLLLIRTAFKVWQRRLRDSLVKESMARTRRVAAKCRRKEESGLDPSHLVLTQGLSLRRSQFDGQNRRKFKLFFTSTA